ncbi:MAG: DMT family transporter [Microbacteriaceae bacterium]|nr:DMT family transporter [Microbacteriaceae bacterium]
MKKNSLAVVALLGVTIAWGASFVVMKPAMELIQVYDFLAIRFTIAALLMILVRPKTILAFRGETLKYGLFLGAILAIAYITQTIGLTVSTAAITGFITGLYVVLTPLLIWLFFAKRPKATVAIAVLLATLGLGLITIKDASFDPGQLWILAGALAFALHIVGLSRWSQDKDVYALTVIQLAAVGIFCWMGAVPDGVNLTVDPTVWFAILFTAVFATALAFFVQTWAQSIMDASRVAIILTMEVVFAALTSVLVGQEVLSIQTTVGGVLMLIAMLVVEWPRKDSKLEDVVYEPMPH